MLALLRHDWPRNVRELSKVAAELTTALLERAPLPAPPIPKAPPHEIPAERSSNPGQEPRGSSSGSAPRNDARSRPSRDELYAGLDAQDFDQADVARALGVPYTTLDRWMRELGVVRPRDSNDDHIRAARETAGGDLTQMARLLRVSVRGLKARLG